MCCMCDMACLSDMESMGVVVGGGVLGDGLE